MRNRSENQITLCFIRHGATKSNREHRYLGKTDERLCEEGKKELLSKKAGNVYPKVDYVFSSPMKRCIETAEILYSDKKPILVPEWEETDFGAFEGKNYEELKGDVRYQEWINSNGMLPFPEGEGREDFMLRVSAGFEKVVEQIGQLIEINEREKKHRKKAIQGNDIEKCTEQKGGKKLTVGLILHGGIIMSLLSNYGGGEYYDYQVSNGEGFIGSLVFKKEIFKIADIERL